MMARRRGQENGRQRVHRSGAEPWAANRTEAGRSRNGRRSHELGAVLAGLAVDPAAWRCRRNDGRYHSSKSVRPATDPLVARAYVVLRKLAC